MLRKFLHLTVATSGSKVVFHPEAVDSLQEASPENLERRTLLRFNGKELWVREPYDQVLRLWADALED